MTQKQLPTFRRTTKVKCVYNLTRLIPVQHTGPIKGLVTTATTAGRLMGQCRLKTTRSDVFEVKTIIAGDKKARHKY